MLVVKGGASFTLFSLAFDVKCTFAGGFCSKVSIWDLLKFIDLCSEFFFNRTLSFRDCFSIWTLCCRLKQWLVHHHAFAIENDQQIYSLVGRVTMLGIIYYRSKFVYLSILACKYKSSHFIVEIPFWEMQTVKPVIIFYILDMQHW